MKGIGFVSRLMCALALAISLAPVPALASEPAAEPDFFASDVDVAALAAQGVLVASADLGIGGGGALFCPVISPHDSNTFMTSCDMGGMYVSHDGGARWTRHMLTGGTDVIAFDPDKPGVVFAGGSGLSMSADNGDTWQLIWPRPSSITGDYLRGHAARHYFSNTDGFPSTGTVTSVACDPKSDGVYALVETWGDPRYNLELYQGVPGAAFKLAARLEGGKDAMGVAQAYDNTKLVFVGDKLALVTQRAIYRLEGTKLVEAHKPPTGCACFVDVAQATGADGSPVYVVVTGAEDVAAASSGENPSTTDGRAIPRSRLLVTSDFTTYQDLTDEMMDESRGLKRAFRDTSGEATGGVIEPRVTHLAASGSRVYFTAVTCVGGAVQGACDTLGYLNLNEAGAGRWGWAFGYGFSYQDILSAQDISNPGNLVDSYYAFWGIAADPHRPDSFLLATGGGAIFSDDADEKPANKTVYPFGRETHLKQLYTTRTQGEGDNAWRPYYATTGINELTSYGLRQDPFVPGRMAILYTDTGPYVSEDAGASWTSVARGEDRAHEFDAGNYGVTDEDRYLTEVRNSYDLAYDAYMRDRAYSLWSNRHDAPYGTEPEWDSDAIGCFAVTSSGGLAWTPVGGVAAGRTWSSGDEGLPARCVPVKMAVVYPEDAEARLAGTNRTIWVACFGQGVFVSRDSGQHFARANEGIAADDGLIYACDVVASADGSQVYLLVAPRTDKAVAGSVWHWGGAAWEPVELPSGVTCPRSLCLDDASGTLYLACEPDVVAASGDNVSASDHVNVGGGLYRLGRGESAFEPVDAESAVVGAHSSVAGACVDAAGNLFVSDIQGSVYLRRVGQAAFEKLCDRSFWASKGVQLVAQAAQDGARTDTLAVPTFGGGLLRLDVTLRDVGEAEDNGGDGRHDPANEPGGKDGPVDGEGGPDGTGPSDGDVPQADGPAKPGRGERDRPVGGALTWHAPTTPREQAAAPVTPVAPEPETPLEPVTPTRPDSVPPVPSEPTTPVSPSASDGRGGALGRGGGRGWRWTSAGWRYETDDGAWATGWLWEGRDWYWLGADGVARSGWQDVGGAWYYLNERHDGTYGAMTCGWQLVDGVWYWLNPDPLQGPRGMMWRSRWLFDRGSWYALGSDGSMRTGWWWGGDAWYYLRPDGSLLTAGWTPDGCLVDASGHWVA